MANKPENLKPFEKGKDPRRHKKQKGEVKFETRFNGFILDWCKRHNESPQKIQDETWESLRKMAKKDFRALSYFLDRLYGKEPDKFEGDIKTEGKLNEKDTNLILKALEYAGVQVTKEDSNEPKDEEGAE